MIHLCEHPVVGLCTSDGLSKLSKKAIASVRDQGENGDRDRERGRESVCGDVTAVPMAVRLELYSDILHALTLQQVPHTPLLP
jgi:hypothetical protein